MEEFERRIKALNWLALNTRWQEDDGGGERKLENIVRERLGNGSRVRVVEVESVGEVGEMMRSAGLDEMFQSVFRL